MTTGAGDAPPRVSVCVSTHNRAALLPRLFAALAAQTLPAAQLEVVVVDDGSTDRTEEVLADLARQAPFVTRVLRHPVSRGPAAGRNAAWRAAASASIAFTDDDCTPAPGWLRAGLERLEAGRRVVVGRVERNPEQAHRDGTFARRLVVGPAEKRWFATANIFYRREDLELLGGFDERFHNAACEDTDLGLRAEAVGVDVEFVSAALVFHDVRAAGAWDRVRDQLRWSDLPLVVRLHRSARADLLQHGVFWRRTHPELFALLGGLALARRRPPALALAAPWLHGKLCRDLAGQSPAAALADLPGLLAVDLAEVVAMVRGSIRYRTLVL